MRVPPAQPLTWPFPRALAATGRVRPVIAALAQPPIVGTPYDAGGGALNVEE